MSIRKIAAVFLSIVTLLTFIPSSPTSAADSVLNDPELNDYIAEYTEAGHTPGLSLVAVDGKNVSYPN